MIFSYTNISLNAIQIMLCYNLLALLPTMIRPHHAAKRQLPLATTRFCKLNSP